MFRMPIVDEKAPRECDFDNMLSSLRDVGPDTACVFNCQMGKGRTTLGMVAACLVKEITITAELRYSLFINGALGYFISIIIVGH